MTSKHQFVGRNLIFWAPSIRAQCSHLARQGERRELALSKLRLTRALPVLSANFAVLVAGGFSTPRPPPPPLTRLTDVTEKNEKKRSNARQKSCRYCFHHFSPKSKLWPQSLKDPKFQKLKISKAHKFPKCSLKSNMTSVKVHYLGNYYIRENLKKHSKPNDIFHRIIFVRFDPRSIV